jgi:hypothetical protein
MLKGYAIERGYGKPDEFAWHKFKERFGREPLVYIKYVEQIPPDLKTRNWIRSRLIAYATRYVMLPHYIMDTFAWQRLSVTARAAWLEFVRLHNSYNNGKIAMSERTLAKKLGVVRNTANRAIKELLTLGFIVMTKGASFIGKRHAAEYRLTHLNDDVTGELPSKTSERPRLTATVWLAMSSKALAIMRSKATAIIRAKAQLP